MLTINYRSRGEAIHCSSLWEPSWHLRWVPSNCHAQFGHAWLGRDDETMVREMQSNSGRLARATLALLPCIALLPFGQALLGTFNFRTWWFNGRTSIIEPNSPSIMSTDNLYRDLCHHSVIRVRVSSFLNRELYLGCPHGAQQRYTRLGPFSVKNDTGGCRHKIWRPH